MFPDDCRVCEQPLRNLSRIPVCPECLALPEPLQASFSCQGCRTPFVSAYSLNERGLCAACDAGATTFDAAYCYGAYEGSLRELIHLFKYGKVETLARPLAKLLSAAIPLEAQIDTVLPMPMHWRKQWERGFNQAELLAQPIAKRYGVALSHNLKRSRYTKSQAGLSEAARRDNLKESFRVAKPEQLAGKRVLLVDDVFTTGSTLRAASQVLKLAGARHITCLTLGRVDRSSYAGNSQSLEALRVATGQNKSEPSSELNIRQDEDPGQVLIGTGVGDD